MTGNAALFMTTAVIWGSTWLAIRHQLGVVDPLVSASYRSLMAAAVMLVCCRLRGVSLRFGPREHLFMALQGVMIFGLNYWFVYEAEEVVPSGLAAIVFSAMLFANVVNGRVFLAEPVQPRVLAGGLSGLLGIGLVFLDDLAAFSLTNRSAQALAMIVAGAYVASLGSIVSARNQRAGLTVLQTNTLALLYGGVTMLAVSGILGRPLVFDGSPGYVVSLTYLAVCGSVVSFGTYLTLVGRIGADRAGYVVLLMPVIALILMTLFEEYRWTPSALAGACLVLCGNFLALTGGTAAAPGTRARNHGHASRGSGLGIWVCRPLRNPKDQT